MSLASSGGVCSSVSRIARRISRNGPEIAARTSSLCSWIAVGRPVTRWRPRTSSVSSDPQRGCRADRDLDRLRGPGADRELVHGTDVVGDGVIHLVAPDPDRAGDHDPPEGDHRHLAGPPADVDDHPADRLLDRQPGADGRGDRLLDQMHPPGAGGQRGLLHGPLLDLGDARGSADDQARMGHAPVEHLADEVAQHLLGDLEIGDHAVAQRARGRDRGRGAPDHPLGLGADGVHLAL